MLDGVASRIGLMTQGLRIPRLASPTRLVRAALLLSLFIPPACAKADPEPMPGLPEGPPFAPSLKPEWLEHVRDNAGLPVLDPNRANRQAEDEFHAYLEAVKNAKQISTEGF